MILSLNALPDGEKKPFSFSADWDTLAPRVQGMRFAGPIRVEGFARRVEEIAGRGSGLESVEIDGTIQAQWHTECDRCLAETDMALALPFHACFMPAASSCFAFADRQDQRDDESLGDDIASLEDEYLYQYSGERVDLTDMVQDEILINLPSRVLCKEDCKGLCPRCGLNRNSGICSCQQITDDEDESPMKALAALIIDDEEV